MGRRLTCLLACFAGLGVGRTNVAHAAPEPALVRFTNLSTGHYLSHDGGNLPSVKASSQTPSDRDSNDHPYIDAAPDMWRLVDWNAGALVSGDSVSFAVRAQKEPFYLRATSCNAGSRPNTQRRATMSSGLTSTEIFTIHAIRMQPSCVFQPLTKTPGPCILTPTLAPAGTPITNESQVAIRTAQSCYLAENPDKMLVSDQVSITAISRASLWNLWYKVIPRSDDDFVGHVDNCFGGVGAGCWNNPTLWPFTGSGTWSTTASGDGNNTYKTIDVSVGSIAHDNCCVRNPTGKVCGGVFSGDQETSSGVHPPKGVMAVLAVTEGEVWQGTRCEWEWQRAIDGTSLFNTWTHRFGPYYSDENRACPGCRSAGEQAWGLSSDRLFKRTTNRRAWLLNQNTWKRWIDDISSSYPDGSNEVDVTSALRAPPGTHIYPAGVYSNESILGDFCSTQTAHWDISTAWVCADAACPSHIQKLGLLGWECE